MAKDDQLAVRNQKVFVRLEKVIALGKAFERTKEGTKVADSAVKGIWQAREQAFEQIITLLELPIY